MDCEKFDSFVLDELYDELDEVTHAAMKRHAETCGRCSGLLAGLRATREVGVLPLVEPSDGLEARILEAAAAAQRKAPWHRKVMRGVAWAGSHAMRPQLAMAAVLVLMLGSSLLLIRARPGSPGAAPVRVTEHGEPVPEAEVAAQVVAEPAPPPAAAVAGADRQGADERRADDAKSKEKGSADESGRAKDEKDEATVALSEARSVRSKAGCSAAVGKFDDVGVRFPSSAAAADAMWEAAACYKSMGNPDKARELYVALRNHAAYKDRAESELALAEANTTNSAPGGGARGGAAGPAAPARKAAAGAAKPKAVMDSADPWSGESSPPAASPPPGQGGTGKAPASPTRNQANGL